MPPYDYGETTHKYLIGYYLPKGLEIPKTYTRLSVPARTWAVFPTLEESTHSIWRRVYSEWFPTSKYEQDEGVVIEVFYGSGWENVTYDHGEVWIPVKLR